MDNFFFAALPYIALLSLIVGSVLRYKMANFSFSSLSSQFLEGRELFWGSQTFHWGLIFLFFGHLIAFLFPASLIAWNGHSVRLLILEATAFAFGLSVLLGLILLIIRRAENKRLHVVTSYMDILVYVILLTQTGTGLWIAVFSRWGSSWFAASVTPYLNSVFALNPDAALMAAMPLVIQLHVIFAFVMIAMIPFTRFVHFLIYPFAYLWRSYLVYIWNWNPKTIRKAEK